MVLSRLVYTKLLVLKSTLVGAEPLMMRRNAEALFRRRHARVIDGYSPTEVRAGIDLLTDEAQSWLDRWGLAYTLMAVGYRPGWTMTGVMA